MPSNPFIALLWYLVIPMFACASAAAAMICAVSLRRRVWDAATFTGGSALLLAALTSGLLAAGQRAASRAAVDGHATVSAAPTARAQALHDALTICADQQIACRVMP